ncbi:MAG: hypothetical protein OEX12_01035 [Gammaproteobacteria bacterium]|nr:hypothetical protein [Gammaproteobacteria bacterium]
MARGMQSVRRKLVQPFGILRSINRRLEDKGLFLDSNIVKKSDQAKAALREQQNNLLRQKQAEQLRVAELDDEIGRKKLLAKFGGRRSLIASR